MLPSTIFASLAATAEPVDTSNLSSSYEVSDDSTGEDSPFLAILSQLGLEPEQELSEQDIAAFLNLLGTENGQTLPQSTDSVMADSNTELPQLEGLTGDDLMAYLMANAGNDIPVSVDDGEMDSELSLNLMLAGKLPPAQSDQAQAVDEQVLAAEGEITTQMALDAEILSDLNKETQDNLEQMNAVDAFAEQIKNTDEKSDLDSESSVNPGVSLPELNSEDNTGQTEPISEQMQGVESVNDKDRLAGPVTGLGKIDPAQVESPSVDSGDELTTAEATKVSATVAHGGAAQTSDAERALKSLAEKTNALNLDGEANEEGDAVIKTDGKEPKVTPVIGGEIKPAGTNPANSAPTVEVPAVTKEAVALNVEPELSLEESVRGLNESTHQFSRVQTKALNDQATHLLNAQLATPMKLSDAGQALADKIQTMVAGEFKQAFIRLDPPELGALEIKIQVQQEQTQVQIVTQSSQVRDALEQQSARLRESLNEQGMNLANLDVSDQSASNSQDGGGERDGSDSTEQADGLDEPSAEVVTNSVGLVDQYV